jgi:hypothetical protein
VLVQGARRPALARSEEGVVLSGRECAILDEPDRRFEDRRVPRMADVLGRGVGQPERVVRESSPETFALRRMPPMQHVAFGKLVRCVKQDLRTRQRRRQPDQRRGILQLIAESEGTPDW